DGAAPRPGVGFRPQPLRPSLAKWPAGLSTGVRRPRGRGALLPERRYYGPTLSGQGRTKRRPRRLSSRADQAVTARTDLESASAVYGRAGLSRQRGHDAGRSAGVRSDARVLARGLG